MHHPVLSAEQLAIVERPTRGGDTLLAYGPAGAGKSVALQQRLLRLLSLPIRGETILVLVPDRAARVALEQFLLQAQPGPHGRPVINTYYGLARQMVDLFWPAIAAEAGFANPGAEPTFLTYETSQYLMYQIVEPLREKGYFGGLRIRPRRLTSQLLDNLNKAAINDYPHTEAGERLARSDIHPEHTQFYQHAQECANRFRLACLERNALDVSLTIEVFHRRLLPQPLFWSFFSRQFRHLIVDNIEETVPVAQELIARLLIGCDSATLAYDEGGGFRILLGVDPDRARALGERCQIRLNMPDQFIANPNMRRLSVAVAKYLEQPVPQPPPPGPVEATAEIHQTGLRSEMIAWTTSRIAQLVHAEGVRPADIAVICPYADGVLRFGLQEALTAQGVPFQLVRRWLSFRDDAAARALLTLASLAHPSWEHHPSIFETAEAFHVVIAGLDLPRAMLLADRLLQSDGNLAPADSLGGRDRERIGFAAAEAYGRLHNWLSAYRAGPPATLDQFLERLFGEQLCQPVFWSSTAPAAFRVACARLIDSARKFRLSASAVAGDGDRESPLLGRDYIRMINQGIVAGQYVEPSSQTRNEAAVLLVTPAYAYLLEGRSSDYHFWMDVGSRQWWRPPHQPLTNPIVLRSSWEPGARWDENKDAYLRNWLLARMTDGLVRRCRKQIFLCGSDRDSLGNPQDGPLFPALIAAFAPEVAL